MNNMKARLGKIKKELDSKNLAKVAHKFFKDITPIDTGNARNKTKLESDTINADYPYAGVLDKGRHMTSRGMRGSNQAPDGMTKPTIKHLQEYIKKI
jgi:hypothetical protein